MNRIVLMMVAMAVLFGSSAAIQVNERLGLYVVEFNLTTIERLYVTPVDAKFYKDPSEGDFLKTGMKLEDGRGRERGWVGINVYNKPISESLEDSATAIVGIYRALGYTHVTQDWRPIGDRPGFVVVGIDENNSLHWNAECRLSDSRELVLRGETLWTMKNITDQLDSIRIRGG